MGMQVLQGKSELNRAFFMEWTIHIPHKQVYMQHEHSMFI